MPQNRDPELDKMRRRAIADLEEFLNHHLRAPGPAASDKRVLTSAAPALNGSLSSEEADLASQDARGVIL